MKNYLNFAKKYFDEVLISANQILILKDFALLRKKVNQNIEKEFKINNINLDYQDCIIDFFNMPQNRDILYNCIEYFFIGNIAEKSLNMSILDMSVLDDVKIYFLRVIHNYYPQIDNIEVYESLQNFVSLFYKISTFNYGDDLIMDFAKTLDVFKNWLNEFLNNREKQIKKLLNTEHIIRNCEFEKIRMNYNKVIKQINSSGFIYLLGEYKFNEFYISPILLYGNGTNYFFANSLTDKQIDEFRHHWEFLFYENNIAYVIGGAGYGKSLFLKNLSNNYSKLKNMDSENYLVIYCDLKSYFYNDYSKKSIIDFITESLIQNSLAEGITKEFVAYYINIGRCLFLFDALDEVPKDKRASFHDKIIAFIECENPSNKACITSRNKGFIPKDEIKVHQIIPLTQKDINDYLDKMIQLKKFKKADKDLFMEQANDLINKGFLNNFLILSLLVNIFKSEQTLPQNKIELYKKCFEFIAKKREEEKSKIGYDWKKIFPLMKENTFIKLANLAAPNNKNIQKSKVEELLLEQYSKKYTNEAEAEYAIGQFLEFCSNRTELFVPSSVDDEFKFFHRSFFEYFYSQYIVQKNKADEMYDSFKEFDIDSEVFELTTAILKESNEEKYQDLVDLMLLKIKTSVEPTKAFCILSLAMQVIDDKCYIRDYIDIFIEKFESFDENIMLIDQNLLTNLLKEAIEIFPEKKDMLERCIINDYIKYHLENNFFNLKAIQFENDDNDNLKKHLIHSNKINNNKIPYYITYFQDSSNMAKIFEEYTSNKSYMNKIFRSVNSKLRRKMNRALKNYSQLSDDKKNLYWESFLENEVL